jgi:hypothetical protein
MLAIGGASLEDCPDDIERRLSLACLELSRLTGRIRLIDSWQDAGRLNGHQPAADEFAAPALRVDEESIPPQDERKPRPTLQ